jgi:hypothetical protein
MCMKLITTSILLLLVVALAACTTTSDASELPLDGQEDSNQDDAGQIDFNEDDVVDEGEGDNQDQDGLNETDGSSIPDGQRPCTREYMPVCGMVQEGFYTTFANDCLAENAGATNITVGECVDEEVNLQGACLSFDGTWLEDSMECEGMSQEQCESLGGEFNECASACRNDPEAQVCTLQCIVVCDFS